MKHTLKTKGKSLKLTTLAFTLIELLAVIVILAIIALIATPIVLDIIDDTNESATLRSAGFYLDAVEQAIMKEKMNKGGNFNPSSCVVQGNGFLICDGDTNNPIKVEVDGEIPTEGIIEFINGNISTAELFINEKTVSINSEGELGYPTKEDSNIVFEGDITFTYDEDEGMYLPNICFDQTKFKDKSNYKITISNIDGSDKIYEVISSFVKMDDMEVFSLVDKYKFIYSNYIESDYCMVFDMYEVLDLQGQYRVKIEYLNSDIFPHLLRIESDGLEIFSIELQEGDAILEIKDSNNNIINLNVIVEGQDIYKFINVDDYNTNYMASRPLKPYYELLEKGEAVTVTIIQGDKTYILGGSQFTYEDDYLCSGELYYWGNNKLGYWFGC